MLKKMYLQTDKKMQVVDITEDVRKIVHESGIEDGICVVFVPHTTSAVTINENADPDVTNDILNEFEKIVPFEDNYAHIEGNSAAHIKSSLVGSSEHIIISNKELLLGTWQAIYFVDFDGPRNRKYLVKIIAG